MDHTPAPQVERGSALLHEGLFGWGRDKLQPSLATPSTGMRMERDAFGAFPTFVLT